MKPLRLAAILCSLLLRSTLKAQLIELPQPPGAQRFNAAAINDQGWIAGTIRNSSNIDEAHLWMPDVPNGSTGTYLSLGTDRISSGINNSDTVLGAIAPPGGPREISYWDSMSGWVGTGVLAFARTGLNESRQFSYRQSGASYLFTPGFGSTSLGGRGEDINDYGQVTGVATWGAFVWTPVTPNGTNGTLAPIGSLPGATQAIATGINNQGQVTGNSLTGIGMAEVFLWTPTVPNGEGGAMVSLGEFVGQSRRPKINDQGMITFVRGVTDEALLWVPDEPNGQTGVFLELGELEQGTTHEPKDINSSGQVIGTLGSGRVFLWTPSTGGAGADSLTGDTGDNLISGGDGNDIIDGNSGNDALLGGAGEDTLQGGSGDDSLQGGEGVDTLLGGNGDDRLIGGPGSDTLDGGAGMDRLVGGAGDDIMDGGAGDDFLYGGDGDDMMDCGPGDSQGHDMIDGGAGNDVIFGGQGNDTLLGGPGDDTMDARSGNDDLTPGPGLDTVLCGPGNDTVRLTAGDVPAGNNEIIQCEQGNDTLILTGIAPEDVSGTVPDLTVTDPVTGGTYQVLDVENVVYN